MEKSKSELEKEYFELLKIDRSLTDSELQRAKIILNLWKKL